MNWSLAFSALAFFLLGGFVGAVGMSALAMSSRFTVPITFLFEWDQGNRLPEFVDTVDSKGFGVGVGEWDTKRDDGFFGLVIDLPDYEVRRCVSEDEAIERGLEDMRQGRVVPRRRR